MGNKRFSMKGKGHPSYKNGSGQGYIYFKTRPYLKESCIKCDTTMKLVIHHNDQNPRNNNESNLSTMCRSCHRTLHWSTRIRPSQNQLRAKARHKIYLDKIIKKCIIFSEKFGHSKYYTTKELTTRMSRTRERIRQLRNAGKIEFIKVGKQYLHNVQFS